jgi:tetratricopeptide (TPR) repeat protein/DNA-binding XRE family transcriptional regulator
MIGVNDSKVLRSTLLRAARDERGWTQQELADAIQTTPVNVSRWENSKTIPSPYFRQRLCDVYGKTSAELGLLSPSTTQGDKLWNMPNTRNPFFTGRERLLELLLERLSATRAASLTQAQALFGLGGIGKTQTATEFAFRYVDYYSHVFWLKADTRETLLADVAALAQLLELPELAKDEQYQTRMVEAVKRWLAKNDGWLLILDNADDLLMAQEFLPTKRKGYILFTTRAEAAGQIAASIEVEKLTLEEGTLLLLRASKRLEPEMSLSQAKAEDRAVAGEIAREMDGLPLALVQAAAFIDETGCGLAHYQRLYATHRKALLARRGNLMLNYPKTVATTWSLSFEQIEQQSPAAAIVLRVCAFLAADAIPEELLERGIAELGAIPGAEGLDELELDEALAVLRKYSLLHRNSESHKLNMHRLVQTVLKENMDEPTRRQWAERTVRIVNAAFLEVDYTKDSPHQYYLPHVQECAALIKEYHLHFAEAAQLLYKAGIILYDHGFYPQSLAFQQQALTIREEIFGSDHPDVAESLNAIAMLSRVQNDFEQAERCHQQALAIREKTLGPEHPATVESLNNLGVLYRNQGKYKQAKPLFQQALSIRKRLLGIEHPHTLITLLNLATLYSAQRDYEQAEQILKQALATSERVLNPNDPLIAYNLNLLARLSYEQGNLEQAEKLWLRSIKMLEKTYGLAHPVIAESLNELAKLYFAQGDYAQAQSLCLRAFNISEKTFGPEHPDTIAYREHLTAILNKIKEEQDHGNHPSLPLR